MAEMQAMTICNNIITAFKSREGSKDWAKWEEVNPVLAEILALAAVKYKERESEWQSEYK